MLATEVDEPAGYERSGLTQAQAEAHVQAELKRWGPLIKAAGIRGEQQ